MSFLSPSSQSILAVLAGSTPKWRNWTRSSMLMVMFSWYDSLTTRFEPVARFAGSNVVPSMLLGNRSLFDIAVSHNFLSHSEHHIVIVVIDCQHRLRPVLKQGSSTSDLWLAAVCYRVIYDWPSAVHEWSVTEAPTAAPANRTVDAASVQRLAAQGLGDVVALEWVEDVGWASP